MTDSERWIRRVEEVLREKPLNTRRVEVVFCEVEAEMARYPNPAWLHTTIPMLRKMLYFERVRLHMRGRDELLEQTLGYVGNEMGRKLSQGFTGSVRIRKKAV